MRGDMEYFAAQERRVSKQEQRIESLEADLKGLARAFWITFGIAIVITATAVKYFLF